MTSRGLRLLVLGATLLATTPTFATPPPEIVREADRRFRQATKFYQEGRYLEALHLYQAAYDLIPSPDMLYNIGLAREKVLDYEGCAVAFRQYLALLAPGPSEDRTAAERHLEQCRSRAVIPVLVSSIPSGAAVYLIEGDARAFRGRTPARLEVPPGRIRFDVEMPGYLPQAQEVDVEVGVHPELDFTLEKLSTLRIEADVSGASVQLADGAPEGAPLQRELPAGLYRVRVSRPGHRTVDREVRVEAGQQVAMVVSLPTLPQERVLVVDARPGARVDIDGQGVGVAPLRRTLLAGSHELRVEAPGRLPYAASIVIPEDRDLRLRVHLSPRRSSGERVAGWALLGASTAALVAGSVFGVVTLGDQDDYDRAPTVPLHETGERHARTADILFGTSAVLAVAAGIVYWVTMPESSRAEVRFGGTK